MQCNSAELILYTTDGQGYAINLNKQETKVVLTMLAETIPLPLNKKMCR